MTIFITILTTLIVFTAFLLFVGIIGKLNDLEKKIKQIENGDFHWNVKTTPDTLKKTIVYQNTKKRMN